MLAHFRPLPIGPGRLGGAVDSRNRTSQRFPNEFGKAMPVAVSDGRMVARTRRGGLVADASVPPATPFSPARSHPPWSRTFRRRPAPNRAETWSADTGGAAPGETHRAIARAVRPLIGGTAPPRSAATTKRGRDDGQSRGNIPAWASPRGGSPSFADVNFDAACRWSGRMPGAYTTGSRRLPPWPPASPPADVVSHTPTRISPRRCGVGSARPPTSTGRAGTRSPLHRGR